MHGKWSTWVIFNSIMWGLTMGFGGLIVLDLLGLIRMVQ